MPITSPTGVERISLRGGRICVDFVNTVDNRGTAHAVEYFTSYADVVAWGHHTGLVPEERARRLLAEAERHPKQAYAVLTHVVTLREVLYRTFLAAAEGAPAAAADVDAINEALSHAMARARLIPADDGYMWAWEEDDTALDAPLWPVVRSAAELLTSAELHRVHLCSSEDCGWLFLDTSKNRSRRWCAMEGCGNRAKARRHYQRTRAQL
jgi:predicted RNA-binding Zn ribbon-like protein